ncbi:MAG: hypothetical protein Q9195_004591 [Heterodermia aff. obscurata]
MFDLAGDNKAAQKFLSTDDFTDSDDEPMDESDSEHDVRHHPALNDGEEISDVVEPPTKRRAVTKNSAEAASVPKWSNPDPYTVLPPVDEEPRKKKDVVKLIRKARIATEKEEAIQNEVAANDDFISFGNEDKHSSEDEDYKSSGVPGAPTGPRQANQPQPGQGLPTNGAPGTNIVSSSVSDLGPPPGLPSKPSNSMSSHPVHPLPLKSATTGVQQQNSAGTQDGQGGNLGSRKRTREDEIKPIPRWSPIRKGKGKPSDGSLAPEWVPRSDQNPTPWLAESQHRSEKGGFRLHKEICDFYEYVKPQQFEQTVRESILERLQTAVRREIPDCEVHCFGSFAAGLYLPNADMDVVVISQSFRNYGEKSVCQSNRQMRAFGRYLEMTIAERESVQCITGAKVPIIKLVDRATAIRIDMSFENDTGIIANDTFSFWRRQFPAMPILVTVIKQFLMMRGLNDVATGGLGGFSVTCLVTSLLQNMPRIQIGEVVPEQHLGEMLIEFLDLYGNQLDISRTGITMNPPGYFDKMAWLRSRAVYQANKADRLAIIDPNTPENDISGGSKNISLIFDRFSKAHEEIMIAMKDPTRVSLLDWMLGGDYENFTWQRDHLRDLYERKWGPIEAEPLGIARAQNLKRMFPSIDDIPKSVGSKQNKLLIKKYKDQIGKQTGHKGPKRARPKRRASRPKQAGTSNTDPITID